MSEYTIYDRDGRYRFSLSCPDLDNALLNLKEGDNLIVGENAPDTFLAMPLVEGEAGEVKPLPPAPLEGMVFDTVAEVWVEERTPEEIAAVVAVHREKAVEKINRLRGQTRKRFITSIPGQDLVYAEKERVARAWMTQYTSTGEEPDPAEFGAIHAEVGPGLTGETAYQVAYIYIFMSEQWRQLSPVIERVSILYLNAAERENDVTRLELMPWEYEAEMNATLAAILAA